MKITDALPATVLALCSMAFATPSPNGDYGYSKPKTSVWRECSVNDIVGKKVLIESVDPHNQYKKGGKYGYGEMPRVLEAQGHKWDVTMEEGHQSAAQIFTIEDSGYSHNKYVIRSHKWDDRCLASVVESTKYNSHVLLTDCDKKHYQGGKKSYDDDHGKSGYDDDHSESYDDHNAPSYGDDSGAVYRRDYGNYQSNEKPKYGKPEYEDKHDYGYKYSELSKEWSFLCNDHTHEVMIKSTSGKCLDDYGATEDHVDVTTYPCEDWNAHQYWKLYVVKEERYKGKMHFVRQRPSVPYTRKCTTNTVTGICS